MSLNERAGLLQDQLTEVVDMAATLCDGYENRRGDYYPFGIVYAGKRLGGNRGKAAG